MLLTIKDIALKLQVKPNTVYQWVAQGKIPYTRLPSGMIRFRPDVVDKWIDRRTISKTVSA